MVKSTFQLLNLLPKHCIKSIFYIPIFLFFYFHYFILPSFFFFLLKQNAFLFGIHYCHFFFYSLNKNKMLYWIWLPFENLCFSSQLNSLLSSLNKCLCIWLDVTKENKTPINLVKRGWVGIVGLSPIIKLIVAKVMWLDMN